MKFSLTVLPHQVQGGFSFAAWRNFIQKKCHCLKPPSLRISSNDQERLTTREETESHYHNQTDFSSVLLRIAPRDHLRDLFA
jgi:hypothetical protein